MHSTISAHIISDPNLVPRVLQAHGNQDDPLVVAEWKRSGACFRQNVKVEWWRKFIHNGTWKRTLAGMSVQALQQMSVANLMTYYVLYVFEMVGLAGNINLISSGVQYALFIIFTTVMFFFIDNTGRSAQLEREYVNLS
ncbi:hypothetical protein NA56DRAFT_641348 [Hyaloscypha hepaticicola]|uniref:Uncharacterized protein n=1 Tax=Hyaloscypha hepaticicola TaxID=2082293 RepID=A0A2J6QK50_9HELO|nr:hypothetical protein NA56DRAFT_641348 [Hyaloscypha hepaticicola]